MNLHLCFQTHEQQFAAEWQKVTQNPLEQQWYTKWTTNQKLGQKHKGYWGRTEEGVEGKELAFYVKKKGNNTIRNQSWASTELMTKRVKLAVFFASVVHTPSMQHEKNIQTRPCPRHGCCRNQLITGLANCLGSLQKRIEQHWNTSGADDDDDDVTDRDDDECTSY